RSAPQEARRRRRPPAAHPDRAGDRLPLDRGRGARAGLVSATPPAWALLASKHAYARRHRPAHALGPRVVLAVPDLPPAPRPAARRAVADARVRLVVLAFPARRPDRGTRRLPRGSARSRGRAGAPRELRPARDRSVDGP